MAGSPRPMGGTHSLVVAGATVSSANPLPIVQYDSAGNEIGTSSDPQSVRVVGPSTAFGELLTAHAVPVMQAFANRIDDARVFTTVAISGATTGVESGQGKIATGTTNGASAYARTRESMPYRPGEGSEYRFTARFQSGVASSEQLAGPVHEEAGFAFGYNGTAFGVLHRYGRRLEIQSFTVDTAASVAANCTVTLNGTGHTVALTDASGDAAVTAREIAEGGPFADSGSAYSAIAIGAVIYFTRAIYGAAGGSFTFAAGATGASVTVAQTQAGADGTSDWTAQTAWNVDPMDGTGPSGMTLDGTKGNVYSIKIGYLGYLIPLFCVYLDDEQRAVPVHYVPWNNAAAADAPVVADPRFPVAWAATSLGSTTDIAVRFASGTGFLQGDERPKSGPEWTAGVRVTAGVTEAPALSIMSTTVLKSAVNRRRATVHEIRLTNESSNKTARIRVYRGLPSDLTGYAFDHFESDAESAVLIDTSATAKAGGFAAREIKEFPIGPTGSLTFDLRDDPIEPGEVLIITTQTDSSTAAVNIGIDGHEDP